MSEREKKVELVRDILRWHMLLGQRIDNSECREMMARDIVEKLEGDNADS